MKQLLAFSAIVMVILACSGEASSETAAASVAPPVDGAKIYKQYCVTCHGLYGDMGASGAFNLTVSTLTVEQRIQVITNGRNAMTGFGALLSPDKIKAVAKYTLELKKQ